MRNTHAADLDAIEKLDAAWNEAYVLNDRSRLQRILAADFEGTDASFRIISKPMLMEPTPAPKQIAFSEQSVKLFGGTAITRGRLQLTHASGTVDQRFLRVYAKRGSRWEAVAVQTSPVDSSSSTERSA
jgi:ketosteroid isomerase-like protein